MTYQTSPKPYKRYTVQVSLTEVPYNVVGSTDSYSNNSKELRRGESEQIMHSSSTHATLQDALNYATRVIGETRSMEQVNTDASDS